MRGFVFDILTLGLILFVIIISMLFGYVFLGFLNKEASDRGLYHDKISALQTSYKDVDGFIGLGFTIIAITMLTYAYLSNSPAVVILMFCLIGMVLLTFIINMETILTEMFNKLTAYSANIKTDFPITYFIVSNFSILTTLTLFAMGAIMHFKSDTNR